TIAGPAAGRYSERDEAPDRPLLPGPRVRPRHGLADRAVGDAASRPPAAGEPSPVAGTPTLLVEVAGQAHALATTELMALPQAPVGASIHGGPEHVFVGPRGW